MSHDLRVQQHAGRAAFFIPGFAIASWAPLVPIVKSGTGLDDAMLGLVLLCLGTGALLAMPLAGAMTARQGCQRVLAASALLIAAVLPLLVHVQTPWLLGGLLFFFGVGNGVMDCTMNIQAVMIERDSGRPMMSGFHAFYSIGGFVGVGAMTAMLSLGWPAAGASVLAVLVLLGVALFYGRHWRADRVERAAPALAWPKGSVVLIGALCFITFLAEGAMLDWSAVFLNEVRAVEASHAGLGYATFAAAMTLARLVGDRWVRKLGGGRALVLGASGAFAGFLITTLVPVWQLTLLGYVLIGLGCANVVPILFSLAGRQKSMSANLAIPAVTTLGYAGVLAGPALIGFVAHATNLVVAFLAVGLAMLVVAMATRWLRFD